MTVNELIHELEVLRDLESAGEMTVVLTFGNFTIERPTKDAPIEVNSNGEVYLRIKEY